MYAGGSRRTGIRVCIQIARSNIGGTTVFRRSIPASSRRAYLHTPQEHACILLKSMPAFSPRACLHTPQEHSGILRKSIAASSCRESLRPPPFSPYFQRMNNNSIDKAGRAP
nr:hypothetical protein [Candidatus Electrothrix aestuarii]